jgi:hypothetical protein
MAGAAQGEEPMTDPHRPWSRCVALDDIPDEGLQVELHADAEVRASLARTAQLRDLPRLEARFEVRKQGSGRLHVTGEVSAIVGQNCVITLEPIEQNLVELVDVSFAPEAAGTLDHGEGEGSFAMADAELPEPMVGGVIDLGAIATEYLLLGIDPYPRKEGAVFESATAGNPAESPFAALAALKKPPLGTK